MQSSLYKDESTYHGYSRTRLRMNNLWMDRRLLTLFLVQFQLITKASNFPVREIRLYICVLCFLCLTYQIFPSMKKLRGSVSANDGMIWRCYNLCLNEIRDYMVDLNEICQDHIESALITGDTGIRYCCQHLGAIKEKQNHCIWCLSSPFIAIIMVLLNKMLLMLRSKSLPVHLVVKTCKSFLNHDEKGVILWWS